MPANAPRAIISAAVDPMVNGEPNSGPMMTEFISRAWDADIARPFVAPNPESVAPDEEFVAPDASSVPFPRTVPRAEDAVEVWAESDVEPRSALTPDPADIPRPVITADPSIVPRADDVENPYPKTLVSPSRAIVALEVLAV